MRSFVSFDNVAIVVATCVAVAVLYVVPKNFDFLNPITRALGDFDLTDMVYSQFRDDSKVQADTTIAIVNIGDMGRAQIAQLVAKLSSYRPLAIGVDAFFRAPKADVAADSMLSGVLKSTPHVVLVSKVSYKGEDVDFDQEFDTLETSHPMFSDGLSSGYANLIIDQEQAFMTVREVSFTESCAGRLEWSFPMRLAQFVDSAATTRALERSNSSEVINFRGGLDKFYVLEGHEIIDGTVDAAIVGGKVVLLGYLGDRIGDKSFEDNFFTPLNERYAGRSYPDMYGVVVHANVVSMILHGTFINTMPAWSSIAVALLLLIFNTLLFTAVYKKAESWYDTFAIVIQLVESLAIVFITVAVFDAYRFKLDLTLALFGVALVGTMHDLYQDSLKKIITNAVARYRAHRASLRDRQRTLPRFSGKK